MKLTKLTQADLDRLAAALPKDKPAPPPFHQEELQVDSLSVALVRPSESTDARTNTYSIGFKCGDSQYVIIVRPTAHQIPSITLNIIRDAQFSSYTVLHDTVTTLKGEMSGVVPADADLDVLLGHLKVSD